MVEDVNNDALAVEEPKKKGAKVPSKTKPLDQWSRHLN